ncbi:MAG: hypothetical protein M3Z20_22105 [Chloroflexota bacterium]|nr:hypothetical protein [Chloroflexota bacterium]
MDPSTFDAVVKSCTQEKTRRRIVALLAALPLGGLLTIIGEDAVAEKPHERLRRRTRQRNRKQRRKQRQKGNSSHGGGRPGDSGTCTPQCAGKTCGPDGCGGSCGTCAANSICHDGACQACDVCPTCSFKSIQDAVNDSGQGTIYICPGTYYDTLTIDRDCALIGAGQGEGPDDTVLDGLLFSVETAFIFTESSLTLQSLRIKNVQPDFGTSYPSGVVVATGGQHTLTMIDCTLTRNTTNGYAPVYCNLIGGKLEMTDCTISNNSNQSYPGPPSTEPDPILSVPSPGAIYTVADSTLTNCVISGNLTRSRFETSNGGGIWYLRGTHTLNNTSITGNKAYGKGGGIYNQGGTVTMQNGSSVTGNTPNNCEGDPITGCKG